MTWVKLDDAFADHPKVMALGRDRMAGLGVWMSAACYCARFLTDGFVPAAVADGFNQPRILTKLVEVGLVDKVDGGYLLHDWLDYNPPRDRVLAERKAAKERMNNHRRSGEVQPNNGRTSDEVRPKFNGPVPVPGPTPVPEVLSNVLTGAAGDPWIEPAALYLERTGRKRLSQKERDWLDDLHVRFSRTQLGAAIKAVPNPRETNFLKRVDEYLEGVAA